ncbi:T9SS type A sorting domain-containing protein [Dyadobacter bucti]|uniref:T9SS type A sorting domain-containing protein n=1 Tax=Dyadobacter bucti TaxID=2572203 RepID=UPI0011097A9F|nr:T9SS type A sorting domain-containing protein [Dyadobacter bucti]
MMRPFSFQKITLFFLLLTASAVMCTVQAQSDQKDKKTSLRIKVREDDNGKVRNIEKNYQVGAMSDEERRKFVDKVLDSLDVKSKNRSVSVTIDDADGNKQEDILISKKRQKVIIDHRDDREPLAFHWSDDLSNDFNFNSEKFRSQWKSMEKDLKPRAKVFMKDMENWGDRMGDFWEKEVTKPASIRALNVYSNNPDNGVLNLRFSVPEKGDVTVTVTDTKGKEVGKREIKDFEGEFVGQIDLKKNTRGTVFVTVVQNEDGTVKRVVIP